MDPMEDQLCHVNRAEYGLSISFYCLYMEINTTKKYFLLRYFNQQIMISERTLGSEEIVLRDAGTIIITASKCCGWAEITV